MGKYAEAVGEHSSVSAALDGIIVTANVATSSPPGPLVSAVDRLAAVPWWSNRGPSIRLDRKLADYSAALSLVLRHANHVMFIDPHLDPAKKGYVDFPSLFRLAAGRSPVPRIEIHRVCYSGSGKARMIVPLGALEATFRQAFVPVLTHGLSIEVFVWDDFHDRYVISNLVGISVPNGFDVASGTARTTWTRLGRQDRDDLQREFDPASGRHKLQARFTLP